MGSQCLVNDAHDVCDDDDDDDCFMDFMRGVLCCVILTGVCRINVMSSWNMGTEFVHPMGSVTSRSAPNGV